MYANSDSSAWGHSPNAARHYDDCIPEDVKQDRLSRLMALQEEISAEIQESKTGTVQRVIIDREEADSYVGRTQYDSPEVDPEVLIEKSVTLKPGDYCNVKIKTAYPFELAGEVVI